MNLKTFKKGLTNSYLKAMLRAVPTIKPTGTKYTKKRYDFMANALTKLGIALLSLTISMIYQASIVALGIIVAYKILF